PSSPRPSPLAAGGEGESCALSDIELSIGRSSVCRPLPARNERGEGWGEGNSNKNATPLPGPLLLLRRKRGRRARSIPLIKCQRGRGLGQVIKPCQHEPLSQYVGRMSIDAKKVAEVLALPE